MKKTFIVFIPIVLVMFQIQVVFGQVLYFDGLGRAVITNDQLKGKVIEGDTLTPNRGTSGYSLLDFGINVKPSESFHARVELRARNNFGQFFGAGTYVGIRQILIEGNLQNKVSYALGDINVEMTPYTVFNNYEQFHSYEGELFTWRRNIVQYENFNYGNTWRLQGVKANTVLPFDSLNKATFAAFGTRTRVSDNAGVPDRFLVGASGNFVHASNIQVGLNYVGFLDNSPTNYNVSYANNVYTLNYRVELQKDKYSLGLLGESGISDYRNQNKKKDTVVSYQDYFIDTKAELKWLPASLKFSVGYKNVGPQFSSPSAQTQRIAPTSLPDLFPTVANGSVNRSQLLSDRLTQERMYNQGISPLLFQVLPIYSVVLPYGTATPNRTGIVVALNKKSEKDYYEVSAEANSLSEIVGVGTDQLRKYLLIKGGVLCNVNKILSMDRRILFSVGAKQESSKRSGFAPVKFQNMLYEAGITVETVRDLELLFGAKYLTADGNEYLSIRDEYNAAVNYAEVNYAMTQFVKSIGFKFAFTKTSNFMLQLNSISVKDTKQVYSTYDLNQLFLNYSLTF